MEGSARFDPVDDTLSTVDLGGGVDNRAGAFDKLLSVVEIHADKLIGGCSEEDGGLVSRVRKCRCGKDGGTGEVIVTCEPSSTSTGTAESLGGPAPGTTTGDGPVGRQTIVRDDRRCVRHEVTFECSHLEVRHRRDVSVEITGELEGIHETVGNGRVGRLGLVAPHDDVVRVEFTLTDGTHSTFSADGVVVAFHGGVVDTGRSECKVRHGRFRVPDCTTHRRVEDGEISKALVHSVVRQEDQTSIRRDLGRSGGDTLQRFRDPNFVTCKVGSDDTGRGREGIFIVDDGVDPVRVVR
mmetsp:Transcript_53330/g.129631  ORF Transcript_53330/g.129631 Transcript_53330/m.129631 type:complete len:296 (-) Transcript_53330:531-1418(-)